MSIPNNSSNDVTSPANRSHSLAPHVLEKRREHAAQKRKKLVVLGIILVIVALLGWGVYRKRQTDARIEALREENQAALARQYPGIGQKPEQSGFDGSVPIVDRYLRDTLNDYESAEYLEWSPVTPTNINGEWFWTVRLKLRAKNPFGAKILKEAYFVIRNDRVVSVTGLND